MPFTHRVDAIVDATHTHVDPRAAPRSRLDLPANEVVHRRSAAMSEDRRGHRATSQRRGRDPTQDHQNKNDDKRSEQQELQQRRVGSGCWQSQHPSEQYLTPDEKARLTQH